MDKVKFYHVKPSDTQVGVPIYPGRFGDNIKEKLFDNQLLAREAILENVRKISFNNKISRLECNYVLTSFEDAIIYQKYCQPSEAIFEIELDSYTKYHRGCFFGLPKLYMSPNNNAVSGCVWSVSENYWKSIFPCFNIDGRLAGCIELLVDSNITLIKKIKDPLS